MVPGGGRYVRYIVIAVFFMIIFYFVSHSGYDTDSLPRMPSGLQQSPAGAQKPPPGAAVNPPKEPPKKLPSEELPSEKLPSEKPLSEDSIKAPTKADEEPVSKPAGQAPPAKQPPKQPSKEPPSEKPADLKSNLLDLAAEEYPLALTPSSPGWNDLTSIAPGPRANATFVTLARNTDVWEIAKSIRDVEDRFNRRYQYDWVFLNDKPFDDTFKKVTTSLVSGKTHYGLIPKEHWSYPPWIDQDKARRVREDMQNRDIIYGGSESYRHMCRFESGFFFRHPLMLNYEYYWRVEPSIELYCDLHYDPFRFMAQEKKKYSFVISLPEYDQTIPTLWDSTKKFMKNHPEHIAKDNSMDFLSEDGGETYNRCHFWSNFEIGSLEWLRSKAYVDFFESLDQDGGFFYERWGDAPVHSIGAGLLLDKKEIHFFNDIGYWHVPFTHCPTGEQLRLDLRCHCEPDKNFDWRGYSCTNRFFETNGMKKPDGWEDQRD